MDVSSVADMNNIPHATMQTYTAHNGQLRENVETFFEQRHPHMSAQFCVPFVSQFAQESGDVDVASKRLEYSDRMAVQDPRT